MKIDIHDIAQRASAHILTIAQRYAPDGHVEGGEWVALNPTRADRKPGSFRVNLSTGRWADFAVSGAEGKDIVSYVAYIDSVSQLDAAKTVAGMIGYQIEDKPKQRATYTELVMPAPPDAPPCPEKIWRKDKDDDRWIDYEVTHRWEYISTTGETLGYVVRCETPDGKMTPTLTLWRMSDGSLKWRQKHFPKPRPIYNGHLLTHCTDAQVIVVEGEKCAEVLQGVIDAAGKSNRMIVIAWPGGGKGVRLVDWGPVTGRRVVLWPDFDLQCYRDTGEVKPAEKQPGWSAMINVARQLYDCDVKIIKPVEGKPSGWDVADGIIDEGMSLGDVVAFVRANISDLAREGVPREDVPREKKELPPSVYEPLPMPPPSADDHVPTPTDQPFKLLGHTGDHYYYLPKGTKRVKAIKGENHSKAFLLTLAPTQYYERNFPDRNGPDWTMAASTLMRLNERIGIYDPDKTRGRGAWYDNGRAVLHLGDHLIVDGKETDITDIESRYIYQNDAQLEHIKAEPLSGSEAKRLQAITDMLFWERPIYSLYLAGWCMIAPICGALKHRPHIWITGGPGTGKSHVVDNVVQPCLGEFKLFVQSATTSAGVRQSLGRDALSVLFDEFESNDHAGQDRIQSVLELARQAFSDTGAKILKGSQSGKAQSFDIRSCFCMSSVAVNLAEHADETRVAVLSLRRPYDRPEMTRGQHFKLLTDAIESTLTPEWCAGLRARAIKLIPVIRRNAETFATVISERTGSRRAGDQIGGMMAGAYALHSDGVISAAAAEEWAGRQDWSEQTALSDDSDEQKCLRMILEHTVKTGQGAEERSVTELLHAIKRSDGDGFDYPNEADESMPENDTDRILKRVGIRYDRERDMIYIAHCMTGIRAALRGAPAFQRSAGRLLERLPNAEKKKSMKFLGVNQVAVGVPWGVVFS